MWYNAETLYATIIFIIALFGTIWYLLWNHRAVDRWEKEMWTDVREWFRFAHANYHRDLAKTKELIRQWKKNIAGRHERRGR
jgi:hypothetical protein